MKTRPIPDFETQDEKKNGIETAAGTCIFLLIAWA
jgi:hypothetical protein